MRAIGSGRVLGGGSGVSPLGAAAGELLVGRQGPVKRTLDAANALR
jgi:hypothetical protein